jgi:hypothetical protein
VVRGLSCHLDSSIRRSISVQRRAAVAEDACMHTPIPLRSTPFSAALDWSRQLGRRAQRDAAARIARDLWTVTAEAALARGHMGVVANLLATELVPALGEAMEALGRAVALAGTPPRERHGAWSVEMLPRLDGVVSKHRRACDVLVVAERRHEAVLGGPPPVYREADGVGRVIERVLDDVALEREGRDPWPGVAARLGGALAGLVEPVDAVVERLDADDLDGAPLVPLKRAMLGAYEDLCEALLFALGRLSLERGWAGPRARATA